MSILQILLASGDLRAEYLGFSLSVPSESPNTTLTVPVQRSAGDLLLFLATTDNNNAGPLAISGPTSLVLNNYGHVASKQSNGTETTFTQTYGDDSAGAFSAILMRNSVLSSGGTVNAVRKVEVSGRTFTKAGFSFYLSTNGVAGGASPPLLPGWTSLATGLSSNKAYRLAYRAQAVGTYSTQSQIVGADHYTAFAHIEAL